MSEINWQIVLGKTESPIETALLTALCVEAKALGYRVGKTPSASDVIAIRPQQRVGRYRADFVVAFHFFGTALSIVVECDGHEFHEKTKHQASRDKARDRHMVGLGYFVMRFSGSEIFRSAKDCALQVLGLVMKHQTDNLDRKHAETRARSAA